MKTTLALAVSCDDALAMLDEGIDINLIFNKREMVAMGWQ